MIQQEQNASASGQQEPYVSVRYEQWAARAYWTPSEIAALSLGKHPWSLNDARSKDNLGSWFTWEFWERRDVFTRAAETGLIDWQCPPNKAVELLKRYDISFEPGLEEAVGRFHPIIDWEKAFGAVLNWAKENQAEHQRQLADQQAALEAAQRDSSELEVWRSRAHALIEQLMAENDEITTRLEQMASAVPAAGLPRSLAANDNDDELPPKLQKSYDVMLAAMAIFGYGFDPASKKSDIGTVIAEDVARTGHSLTPPVCAAQVRASCKRLGINRRPDDEE